MNEEGLAKSFGDSPQSHVLTITANVTSESDWKKAVALAKDKFGGVDIVINNAG
jgi:NAD(P)-dependent dehydrogenase (short-subunit alcohol dehydrogenase family)